MCAAATLAPPPTAQISQLEWFRSSAPLRTAYVRGQLFFPDRKLIQYDCGKLQV